MKLVENDCGHIAGGKGQFMRNCRKKLAAISCAQLLISLKISRAAIFLVPSNIMWFRHFQFLSSVLLIVGTFFRLPRFDEPLNRG